MVTACRLLDFILVALLVKASSAIKSEDTTNKLESSSCSILLPTYSLQVTSAINFEETTNKLGSSHVH
jgi:hypothetical protein